MDITIRSANQGDVLDICRIFRSAIRELAKGHYSAEQIEVWSGRLSPDFVRDGITIGHVYVAVINGEVAGFGRIDLHSGEVAMLFVDPSHARKGVGTLILRYLEQVAVEKGLHSLYLRASLNAAPFYETMGYVAADQISHSIGDISFECIIMNKKLA